MFNLISLINDIKSAQVRMDVARALAGSAWASVASDCHRIAAACGEAGTRAEMLDTLTGPDGETPPFAVELGHLAMVAQWATTAGRCLKGDFGTQQAAFKSACEARVYEAPRTSQIELLAELGVELDAATVEAARLDENARNAVFAQKRSANAGRALFVYDRFCAEEYTLPEDAEEAYAVLSTERQAKLIDVAMGAVKRCENAAVASVLFGRKGYSIADIPIVKAAKVALEEAQS
jgi:hypothetical protein